MPVIQSPGNPVRRMRVLVAVLGSGDGLANRFGESVLSVWRGAEADRGSCRGTFKKRVRNESSDGVDLAILKAVSSNGTFLYIGVECQANTVNITDN